MAVPINNEQGVKAEDVQQGALGDCWLVAAMATLAGTMPGSIKKLFLNSERSFRQAGTEEGKNKKKISPCTRREALLGEDEVKRDSIIPQSVLGLGFEIGETQLGM